LNFSNKNEGAKVKKQKVPKKKASVLSFDADNDDE
jgi:hypothetical protein